MRRTSAFVVITALASASCDGAFRFDPSPSWTIGTVAEPDAAAPSCVRGSCRVSALSAGDRHVCAIVGTEGDVVCWGANEAGQIRFGRPSEPLPPTAIEQRAYSIVAGALATCVTAPQDDVAPAALCWGAHFGVPTIEADWVESITSVGLDDVCYEPIGGGDVQCANGDFGDSVALSGPQRLVVGAGDGNATYRVAQPGVGRLVDQTYAEAEFRAFLTVGLTVPTPRLGGRHGCAIVQTGDLGAGFSLACLGHGDRGQLGPAYVEEDARFGAVHPIPLWTVPFRFCAGGDLDARLVDGEIVLGEPRGGHTCWVDSARDVYCVGANDRGQLGAGTTVDAHSPIATQPTWTGTVTDIYCGGETTCVTVTTHEDLQSLQFGGDAIYCWGDNRDGQLGLDSSVEYSAEPVRVDYESAFAD